LLAAARWLYYMHAMNTVMTWQTHSTGSADTERLGEALGNLLKGREIIELRSDLGGGKTTFVRGLARGAGSRDRVASPTFTLNKIYRAPHLEIHHFDFYRLSEPGVVSDQLEESLQNSRVITVVEWSKIVEDVLPKDRLTIEFKPVADDPDERLVTVAYPEKYANIIREVETEWQEARP
jgi:tRNA threonylcarbamoyladenosine biosynthesis protein TsaE